jgi:superfamily I DNA and/or RNA helicase
MINVDSQESGSTSYENYGERDAVIQYAQSMIGTGYPEGSIAIITPYAAQEKVLKVALRSLNLVRVRVISVDASQGNEFDVVLLSLVRSNRHGKVGFCLHDKRLNVALSRAMVAMIVFGNFKCPMRGDSD